MPNARRALPLPLALLALLAALVAALGLPAGAARADEPAAGPRTADGLPVVELAPGELPAAAPAGGWTAEYRTTYAGLVRSFRVVVPAGLTAPAPVVVGLHGWMQTPRSAQRYMGLERVAPRAVVVYPQGSSASWNAGRCCGGAVRAGVDDLGFLREVQRLVAAVAPVDASRRYAVGFSNGGMMALRSACGDPGAWAAVVVVSAAHVSVCHPRYGQGVPVMHVHGDHDGTVPFAGLRYSSLLGTSLPSVAQTDGLWLRTGSPVLSVRVVGGGHGWPTPTALHGRYDTSVRAWQFLSAYAR